MAVLTASSKQRQAKQQHEKFCGVMCLCLCVCVYFAVEYSASICMAKSHMEMWCRKWCVPANGFIWMPENGTNSITRGFVTREWQKY